MAETAITTVLSKFGELVAREAAVLLQVGEDIMLLRDRLDWLQAFIRDADRKRRTGTDGLTRVWVRQTRDVTFQAEDALDDFFHKVDLESQGYRSWKTWLRYGWWSQITVRHGLSGQIEEIKKRLEQISENQEKYNIEYTPSMIWTSSNTALAPREDLWRKPDIIDKDVDSLPLTKLLVYIYTGHHPQKMFISVLGESGSGKKTLVETAYNMQKSNNSNFRVFIWYSMPPGSGTEDVLTQVYKRASKKIKERNADSQEVEAGTDIAAKLRGLLVGRKYLVVLSGISSKAILNCVGASLPDEKNGSRVVLILEPDAHGYEVRRHAHALNQKQQEKQEQEQKREGTEFNGFLELSRWDEERSARLFHSRVFGEERKGTAEYDKDVYAITEGHPLAIVVLAGFLRHKEPVEWKALIEQLALATASDSKAKLSKRMPSMERIFWASYDDLPQDLKSCFLYFAANPKNISQPAYQIVRMWTAEGFIKPRKGITPEELGYMYLEELVSRCLVQIAGKKKKKSHGGIDKVIVHSRLLEFLQSEARQASFLEVHDRNDVLAPASVAVRRLSIHDDGNGYTPFTTKFPKLRSFICHVEDEEEGQSRDGQISRSCWSSVLSCLGAIPCPATDGHDLNFLCGSRFLRLLSVRGLSLKELPNEIGDMIHLRYLRVHSEGLQTLPSSIKRLLNLQTLDISHTQVEEIDEEFWTIKALRHVLAEKVELPVSLVQELGELQTLHGVHPADEAWDEGNCPLHKMTKLRSLEMDGFKASKHGLALQSALRKMHLLGHLKLKGDEIPPCVLTEPSLRCLQTMELDGAVKWNEIPQDWNVHNVRPNLVLVQFKPIEEMPTKIKEDLGTILVEEMNP